MKPLLRALFDAALAAVDPDRPLHYALPALPPNGRLVIVGAGKAAAAMAVVAAAHYGQRAAGVVVVPHGYGLGPAEIASGIAVLEASHPVLDDASLTAADAILGAVDGLTEADVVVCLLSGGASALMERPAPGVTLDDMRVITVALLGSGAAIAEINTVRRHLSAIKGGRLSLSAWPARVETFAISDVPGDDPCVLASGPTVGDPTTCSDTLEILRRFRIAVPSNVERLLTTGALETPKPGDPRLSRSSFQWVGTQRQALDGAARRAMEPGFAVIDLGTRVEGEARDIARAHTRLAREVAARGAPTVILSGGEATVTHAGTGVGGPNREYALALAIELDGLTGVWALAADTDGIDGAQCGAGAFVTPDTLARAERLGMRPAEFLRAHDSGEFFRALGDDLVTGPTRTNVADFRAIVVDGR